MLEDVAGEGQVDALRRDRLADPLQGQGDTSTSSAGRLGGIGVEVHGDPPRCADVVDELAVAGPDVQHGPVGRYVTREERVTERPPEPSLGGPFGLEEAVGVQPVELRLDSPGAPASDTPDLDLLSDPRDDLVERLGERRRGLEAEQPPRLLDRGDALLHVVGVGLVARRTGAARRRWILCQISSASSSTVVETVASRG